MSTFLQSSGTCFVAVQGHNGIKTSVRWASNRNSTKTFGEFQQSTSHFLSQLLRASQKMKQRKSDMSHKKQLFFASWWRRSQSNPASTMNTSTHQGRAGDAGDVRAVRAIRGVGAVLDLKSFQILKRAWIENKRLLVV